jgi:hypothetical protein
VNELSSKDRIGDTAANPKNAESVANARLIAAAPMLLEACKKALEWSAQYPLGIASCEPDRDAARIVYFFCATAIAAAEGGEK